MQMYLDEYYLGFNQGKYEELKAEEKKLEAESSWEAGIKSIEVVPVETPMDALAKANDPSNTIPYEVLEDTACNAGIMLHYEGKTACVRNCAMPSLLTTAGISGFGVNRVDKTRLAIGLTAFLTGSRETSQILTRAGKVSAVLSSRYQYMPGSELLAVCDSLQSSFGSALFRGGAVAHDLLTAEFEYSESAEKITAAYANARGYAGSYKGTIVPVVQFRSSDTSNEAAKLLTFLKMDKVLMPLGGVYVPHIPPLEFDSAGNRIDCMEKFRQEADGLFSKVEYDLGDLIPKMLATTIDHPGNTFVGLCKYAKIPQKWGGEIEEELRSDWPDHSGCTFLDVYEALTKSTAKAIEDGLMPYSARVLDLEEGICKVARNRASWKKYDLPGTVAWSVQPTAAA